MKHQTKEDLNFMELKKRHLIAMIIFVLVG